MFEMSRDNSIGSYAVMPQISKHLQNLDGKSSMENKSIRICETQMAGAACKTREQPVDLAVNNAKGNCPQAAREFCMLLLPSGFRKCVLICFACCSSHQGFADAY